MKILMVADFRRDSPHFLLNTARMFSKGFVRNGHDVLDFSYRDTLLQQSAIKSKKWALKLAKRKTDQLLLKLATHYQPDIVLITTFKLLDNETVGQLKHALPNTIMMCWYGDMSDGVDLIVADIAQQCHWFLSTGGGQILRDYYQRGAPHCAFLPNPCDPDVEYPRETSPQWKSQLLFTGKVEHGRGRQDPMRRELIQFLLEHKRLTLWGAKGRVALKGQDYLNTICGTDIALSINAYNHIRFYHSDRLIHYLSCGAFVLAKYVPDSDLLFENHTHLCYFESIEQCLELIDRFQTDHAERKKIAQQGLKHAHEMFCCQNLASSIVDLAIRGEYDAPWNEIL